MRIDTESRHITQVGGNVFADLGFEPNEAARLKLDADKIISEKLMLKNMLMTEIAEWITEKNLKQVEAAVILGITRPRVSDVVHKKTLKFTVDSLIDMVSRTGKQIELSFR